MDMTTEMSYPGATVDDVVGLALNADFRAAVCEATTAIEHEVSVDEHDDGSAVVTLRRTMPANVPDFARRFVGETITLEQTETWAPDDGSGVRRASLHLTVAGQPASMTGAISVSVEGGGAVERVNGVVRVSVPFIGGKVETELVKGLVAAARKEQELGREWLSR